MYMHDGLHHSAVDGHLYDGDPNIYIYILYISPAMCRSCWYQIDPTVRTHDDTQFKVRLWITRSGNMGLQGAQSEQLVGQLLHSLLANGEETNRPPASSGLSRALRGARCR